ncbi:hypothetical protein VTK73DRAFT_5901 [Phialemonium thermophilum]|uniref:Uncharacterized protein n=1 Tax=Phialemonium thermophilum TaxID=223376 RepID=A0ABR3WLQ0_9PEZI
MSLPTKHDGATHDQPICALAVGWYERPIDQSFLSYASISHRGASCLPIHLRGYVATSPRLHFSYLTFSCV